MDPIDHSSGTRLLRPPVLAVDQAAEHGGAAVRVHVTMARERQLAVEHWLMAAAEDRVKARSEWGESNVALLSCGTLFSAVRIPAALVEAAAKSSDRAAIDTYLASALLNGPVICDRYASWYYALTPASTAQRWDLSGIVCLGRKSSLGVPRPGITGASGERLYWSVPMDSAAALCSPYAVAQLVVHGRYEAVTHA